MDKIPEESHSEEEFPVKDAQIRAIIRVASYHRGGFPLLTTRLDPRETDAHRTSLAAPFPHDPDSDLGDLEYLPIDILSEIVRFLDIGSGFALSRVSRRGRQIVVANPEYRIVCKHAIDALRVVFWTALFKHFTFLDLCNAVCTRGCLLCGEFGGYVFLPTLSRCCFHCIREGVALPAMPVPKLCKVTGLTVEQIWELGVSIVRTVPGTYQDSFASMPCDKTFDLVATRLLFQLLGRPLPPQFGQGNFAEKRLHRYKASTALPFVEPRTQEVQHGVCCKGCHVAYERNGTDRSLRLRYARERLYSHDGFIRHFRWCAEAQVLWVASREGTVSLEETEFTRNHGPFGP